MSTNAIAKRYAKALVQLGSEAGSVEAFNGELKGFNNLLAENGQISAILENPAYGIESKSAILKELVAKANLSPTISNLLMLLLERGRLSVLPQIAQNYGAYADELSGKPAVIDVPRGKGHVILMSTNPMWRMNTSGLYALVMNAVMMD